MDFTIIVKNRVATLSSTSSGVVCQNLGDTVIFNFDNEWINARNQGEKISALFLWNGRYVITELNGSYSCKIPAITDSNVFYVGAIVGTDFEIEPYLSTTRVEIPCKLSARDYAKRPHDLHAEKWVDAVEQWASEAKLAAKQATDAKNTVVTSASWIEDVARNVSSIKSSVDSTYSLVDNIKYDVERFDQNISENVDEAREILSGVETARDEAIRTYGDVMSISDTLKSVMKIQSQILGEEGGVSTVIIQLLAEEKGQIFYIEYFDIFGSYHQQTFSNVDDYSGEYVTLENVASDIKIGLEGRGSYSLFFAEELISQSDQTSNVLINPYSRASISIDRCWAYYGKNA